MKKTLLGLDIGSKTIKAVQLERKGSDISLFAAGYIGTPISNLALINPKDEQTLASGISRLVHDMKVSTIEVSASLPSSKVVTRIVEMPLMSEGELESSIKWEAEQFIPWPLSKVKIDYAIVDQDNPSQKMKVQLVAAPTDLIEKYMRIISSAGLTPVSLETAILSVARSITTSYPSLRSVIILSIGATTTEIGILQENVLIHTKSYSIGGNTFTSAISQELGFEISQAEEYKKTYGFEEKKLEGKIAKIIEPFVADIYKEIEKMVAYFKQQHPKGELTSIVVCGGTAKLPGLVLSITKNLGLNSQVINPFDNLIVDSNVLPIITSDAPIYTTAVGLALKEV